MFDLVKAQEELKQKNLNDIQKETAFTWGSRSMAAYEISLSTDGAARLAWFCVAEEYFHESLEHASLVMNEDIISQIRQELIPYQEKAAKAIDEVLGNGKPSNSP